MNLLQQNDYEYVVNQPRFQSQKLIYFDDLAAIVGHIDFDKNAEGKYIVKLVGRALKIILEMKLYLFDTGDLQGFFERIRALSDQPEQLSDLIYDTHGEIMRLLGDDVCLIYSPD